MRFLLSFLLIFVLGLANASAQDRRADVIFHHGEVYTMNPRQAWARAVAVKDKKILYVGSNAGAAFFLGPKTKLIDLRGRMLMPGFVEGHLHPIMGAAITRGADLQQDTHAELITYLKNYEKTAPNRGLIDGLVRGMGWRYSLFPLTGPTWQELEDIWPDLPVMFIAADGHSAWLNSTALRKITDTSDPGFKRDSAGQLTGYVVEGNAMRIAMLALGGFTPQFITGSLEEWLPKASAAGITSLFDAGMAIVDEEKGFGIYKDLEKRGKLPVRVVGSVFDNQPGFDPLPDLKKFRREVDTELVQARVLKIVMDGTDANGSAAMLKPYADDPGNLANPNLPRRNSAV